LDELYPEGVTEPQLNKFGEKELPGKFASNEYQVLLVADKYQYGFDQPCCIRCMWIKSYRALKLFRHYPA
jgi:type I site-specific restriction-modification system R (restriction) subunit